MSDVRVGIGFDVHRLVTGRPLILAGVSIPFPQGLEGHSDADALTHAIIDAILGALGQGDIGQWFPDTDPKYRNADSIALLRQVWAAANEAGFSLGNLDATIIAQAPKLAPYMDQMKANLSQALACRQDQINLKATTTEGLGFTGRGEGIAALATTLLTSKRAKVKRKKD